MGGDAWLADHDHIKELDGDLITEGSNGIFLPYSGQIDDTPNFSSTIIDFFEGAAVDVSLGEGHWLFTVQGRYGGTSEANRTTKMGNFKLFLNKHLNFAHGALYLGYRKRGEVWEEFPNNNQVKKYYLKGKLLLAKPWRTDKQNYYNWKVAFRGVW